MTMDSQFRSELSRRLFLSGMTGAGLIAPFSALQAAQPRATHDIPVLTGNTFDLVIGESLVNFNGSDRIAYTVNNSLPAPTLVWREGDTVTIRVRNTLSKMTAIHWHGIILPFQMDGVPGISFSGIAPGETFTYTFQVNQTGTYWYHSHAGFQEMRGLYGGIIILPRNGAFGKMREHLIHLSDWTDEDPVRLFARLKINSEFNNFNEPTVPDFISDIKRFGLDKALDVRKMWNQMRMSPVDLSDLSAYSMSYHLNGQRADQNWTGLFKKGEEVLLRFINSSSNTFFDVRIPGLKMRIVEVDGLPVNPVSVDEFRFGSGETYAAIVTPVEDAHTIFAQTMDRSGHCRGTLAVRKGLEAPVPERDAPEWLSMSDMGHGMSHDHGSHHEHQGPKVRHASSEYGPSVDMLVDNPKLRLDDPGVGLRNNGRKVLTLDDLHSVQYTPDKQDIHKEIELHLTGNMERYSWSIDGLEFAKTTPVHFPHGKRLKVTLHNDTMMTHPMHLHGMWSDVLNEAGQFQVRRHTFQVQPAQRMSFAVTADALGRWAWHCHLLFHMDAGMFREVIVA
ncbi:MAG: copper resistance system multicopper oxidase [Bdellovibrionota bacterium]